MSKPQLLGQIEATFNPTDQSGREYTNTLMRNYVGDSIKKVILSGFTQEKLRLRELAGYLGHGMRILAGKNQLDPVEQTADGVVIRPRVSHVASKLEIDDNYNLNHCQDILDNDEGKEIMALHKGHIGGFSWVVGWNKSTGIVQQLSGFDYVYDPRFTENRGYDLAMDSNRSEIQTVFDSLESAGVSEEYARKRFDQWVGELYLNEMQSKLHDTSLSLIEQNKIALDANIELERYGQASTNRKLMVSKVLEQSPVELGDDFLNALVNMQTEDDVRTLLSAFDSIAATDLGLPLQSVEASRQKDPFKDHGIKADVNPLKFIPLG